MALNCPKCKTTQLASFSAGKDELEKCPACQGLWFGGGELADVEELPESELMNDFQDQLDKATVSPDAGTAAGALCPQCGKPMNHYQYDVSSGIWIDGCPNRDGVWLDRGEVLKVHQHLQNATKALPPEKMQALTTQLKQIEVDEQKKEDADIDELFAHHKGALPAWHVMDGIMRFIYHGMNHMGDKISRMEEKL